MSSMPFDDWFEDETYERGAVPGGVDTPRWFEVEAAGPQGVNRLATVTGCAMLGEISEMAGPGDGTLTIDTGYALDPSQDTAEDIVDGNAELLHSTSVALAGLMAEDTNDRDGWIESVDAGLVAKGKRRHLVLTVKLNIDGDLAATRLSYSVVLLFQSRRPPAVEFSVTASLKEDDSG